MQLAIYSIVPFPMRVERTGFLPTSVFEIPASVKDGDDWTIVRLVIEDSYQTEKRLGATTRHDITVDQLANDLVTTLQSAYAFPGGNGQVGVWSDTVKNVRDPKLLERKAEAWRFQVILANERFEQAQRLYDKPPTRAQISEQHRHWARWLGKTRRDAPWMEASQPGDHVICPLCAQRCERGALVCPSDHIIDPEGYQRLIASRNGLPLRLADIAPPTRRRPAEEKEDPGMSPDRQAAMEAMLAADNKQHVARK